MTITKKENMNPDDQYDLIVIGSGQGGGPLAMAFSNAGRRVALVERLHVGGSCVNEGCSPTKTIIASARVAQMAHRAPEYGVHHDAPTLAGSPPDADIRMDMHRVRERKQKIVDSFRSGNERAFNSAGVELIRGHARFVAPLILEISRTDGASSPEGGRRITAGRIVINSGLRPTIPPLPGLENVDVLDSTSIQELTELPEHLIVLGGGYVGVEFAQAYRRFGSEVTIVDRGSHLLAHEDADVAEAVAGILQEDGIQLEFETDAVRVEPADAGVRLIVRTKNRADERTVVGSHLLVAVGRTPNSDDMGLDAAGVDIDEKGFIRVNERLETSAANVYAIGDIKGGPAFTHISYDDFRILRTNLLEGGERTTTGRQVPYTVFMDPQLGAIGMTESEARGAGHRIRVARLPMSSVARAMEVDETRGVMKAIVDADSGRILGARILGIDGGEIAAVIQVAMMGDLPYTALRDGTFSHPTTAESLNNLFMKLEDAGAN